MIPIQTFSSKLDETPLDFVSINELVQILNFLCSIQEERYFFCRSSDFISVWVCVKKCFDKHISYFA